MGLSGSATIDMHPQSTSAPPPDPSVRKYYLPCMWARARACVLCCGGECECVCACLGVHARHSACTVLLRISRAFRQRRVQRAELVEIPLLTEASRCIASAGSTQRCRTAECESRACVRACVRGHMHACVIGCVRVHACVRKHSRLCACLWVLMSVHECLCVCSCVQSRPAPLVELGVPLEVAHVQCARLGFEPAAGDRATGGE